MLPSFREWLNEMIIKEQNNLIFVLPTDVRKIDHDDYNGIKINPNKIAENYKINEILECVKYFLEDYKKNGKSFSLALRPENVATLNNLGFKIGQYTTKEDLVNIINKILLKLKPSHFRYTSKENGKIAYIFGINVFDNKFRSLNADKDFFKDESTVYIKLQFIFKALDSEYINNLTKKWLQKIEIANKKIEELKQLNSKDQEIRFAIKQAEHEIKTAKYERDEYIKNELLYRSPSELNGKYTIIYPNALICNEISLHKDR